MSDSDINSAVYHKYMGKRVGGSGELNEIMLGYGALGTHEMFYNSK
jgi:hypothetical protein